MIRIVRTLLATLSIYLLAYPLTAVGVILGCLAALVRWRSFIRTGTVAWANLVFLLVGRGLHLEGRENAAPGRAYLVISNHASMFDIPVLMAAVPGIAIMGREYLTRIPLFGAFLEVLHYIPIDTASAKSAHQALDRAAEAIRRGFSVGMFAEGTRTANGDVQALKRGFVHVLRKSGGDLLPVSIRGTFALKPKDTLLMDPRERIQATIGAAVPNAVFASRTDQQVMADVRSILQKMGEESHEAE